MVLVEVVLESLSAGRLPAVPTTIGFHEGWLRAIGLKPDDAALVAVRDKGMEPTLTTHSIALVHRGRSTIETNAIYATRQDKEVLLRRLETLSDGTPIIRGDNSKSRSTVVLPERAGQVEVFGKVVWSGDHV